MPSGPISNSASPSGSDGDVTILQQRAPPFPFFIPAQGYVVKTITTSNKRARLWNTQLAKGLVSKFVLITKLPQHLQAQEMLQDLTSRS
jgi:hypothetical protein